ncbi:recombinase family protein [Starkeya koreensis]|uniref:Recombinase family protein n=1 Tax=Ancylobacter koreensis TaxID=266121 RepID=A0ABT0DRQ6_9HYPH|nr:recombinase family protein [Ancylobacter koreensis]MCK0209874.1 recombinase family protein [Ancylobacter koreensis]
MSRDSEATLRHPDIAQLEKLGCERVFSDIEDDRRADRPGLRAAIEFMRGGDVLVVPSMSHVGHDIESAVVAIARLSEKGATLQIGGMAMDMMIPSGEALAFACRVLAPLASPAATPPDLDGAPRRRGRPHSLSKKDIAKARRLLAAGNAVPQVARALGVSSATVYRIFPRRGQKPDAEGAEE